MMCKHCNGCSRGSAPSAGHQPASVDVLLLLIVRRVIASCRWIQRFPCRFIGKIPSRAAVFNDVVWPSKPEQVFYAICIV